jgi:hypothetical protein
MFEKIRLRIYLLLLKNSQQLQKDSKLYYINFFGFRIILYICSHKTISEYVTKAHKK